MPGIYHFQMGGGLFILGRRKTFVPIFVVLFHYKARPYYVAPG